MGSKWLGAIGSRRVRIWLSQGIFWTPNRVWALLRPLLAWSRRWYSKNDGDCVKKMPKAPALLRCRCIDFSISEQFGGGDMRCLGGILAFRPGLFRPAGTFAIGLEVNLLSQRPQCGNHLCGTHTAEDAPFVLRDRNHHTMIGLGDVVGDIVEGESLINGFAAMYAAQRRHHHRQHIVGDEGQAKAEQGGLGIAQRIDFRMEVRFEMLERGLQRPALAV